MVGLFSSAHVLEMVFRRANSAFSDLFGFYERFK